MVKNTCGFGQKQIIVKVMNNCLIINCPIKKY